VTYAVLADAVLWLHVAFVLFVVVGLALIAVGGWRGWAWVRDRRFRWGHLGAIGVVVAQAWLGVLCPLTTLESALRERAGTATYSGSFIAHWAGELLYFDAPPWVFTACYTAFGLAVALCWLLVRPRPRTGVSARG
jgi:hypothetical protein